MTELLTDAGFVLFGFALAAPFFYCIGRRAERKTQNAVIAQSLVSLHSESEEET